MCLQVCMDCGDAKMPDWLSEGWHLVEEVVLSEAYITLLKLTVKIIAMYQQQPDNNQAAGLSQVYTQHLLPHLFRSPPNLVHPTHLNPNIND